MMTASEHRQRAFHLSTTRGEGARQRTRTSAAGWLIGVVLGDGAPVAAGAHSVLRQDGHFLPSCRVLLLKAEREGGSGGAPAA